MAKDFQVIPELGELHHAVGQVAGVRKRLGI